MRSHRPSRAIVAGALALAVATGGSATAASLITSSQIKDGTIQLRDINKRAQVSLKGHMGPVGAQGPAGAPGPAGAQGLPGPLNLTRVYGPLLASPAGMQVEAWAICPAGAPHVVGGGVWTNGMYAAQQSVNTSEPYYADANNPTDGWDAWVDNRGADAKLVQASAICTKATSVSKTGAAATLKK